MSNFIKQVVNSKINYLRSSYISNDLVNHQGVKGSLNELLLKEVIQDVIPSRYKFANGVIQDCSGEQSNESDLIIYDDDILPSMLFGGELGFVPAESVQYNIEVKTTLNSTEIKSTFDKFKNANSRIGYRGINTLFSFSSDLTKKHELKRYYEYAGESFYISSPIKVLVILDKGYYFLNNQRIYLKEIISKNEFVKICARGMDAPLVINGVKVNIDDCENFDIKGDFVVNGLNFDDLYIDRFYWVGTDTEKFENSFMLTYLSGVSNTLSQGVFGKYLIESSEDLTVYSECIIDMWGNISYKEFDQNGIATSILNNFQYTISLSENGKENKFEIHGKNT